MRTKDENLEDLRMNYSDEELIQMSHESRGRTIAEDSLLRQTSVKFYGEEDGNTVMYMTVFLTALILEVMTDRLEVAAKHICII